MGAVVSKRELRVDCSPMQEGMLFSYLKDPSGDNYFEQLCLALRGKIDNNRFEASWNSIIERNEALRSIFRWEQLSKPVQIILKKHKIKYQFLEYSSKGDKSNESILNEVKKDDKDNKFDLHNTPYRITLCRLIYIPLGEY